MKNKVLIFKVALVLSFHAVLFWWVFKEAVKPAFSKPVAIITNEFGFTSVTNSTTNWTIGPETNIYSFHFATNDFDHTIQQTISPDIYDLINYRCITNEFHNSNGTVLTVIMDFKKGDVRWSTNGTDWKTNQ